VAFDAKKLENLTNLEITKFGRKNVIL